MPCDKGADGKYRLMCSPDATGKCPVPMKMIDARRPNPQAQGGADPNQDYVFADEDNQNPPIFGEQNLPSEPDDVAGNYLYVATLWALELYSQHFVWAGYDGFGQIPILNYVKTIEDPGTYAFYDPSMRWITLDPAKMVKVDSSGHVDILYALVMCHEFTHGVLDQMIPGLVYSGETASLEESFANIMGILAVFYGACYPASDFKSCIVDINHPGLMNDPKSRSCPTTYKGFFYVGSENCMDRTLVTTHPMPRFLVLAATTTATPIIETPRCKVICSIFWRKEVQESMI